MGALEEVDVGAPVSQKRVDKLAQGGPSGQLGLGILAADRHLVFVGRSQAAAAEDRRGQRIGVPGEVYKDHFAGAAHAGSICVGGTAALPGRGGSEHFRLAGGAHASRYLRIGDMLRDPP